MRGLTTREESSTPNRSPFQTLCIVVRYARQGTTAADIYIDPQSERMPDHLAGDIRFTDPVLGNLIPSRRVPGITKVAAALAKRPSDDHRTSPRRPAHSLQPPIEEGSSMRIVVLGANWLPARR